MGEIHHRIRLENLYDRFRADDGVLSGEDVRRIEIRGLVDTGARTLSLPEDVAERLGLRKISQVKVTYADGRTDVREIVGPLMLTINLGPLGGVDTSDDIRQATFDAVVLPAGSTVLIGQIVLERLDLLADCPNERLISNPDSPYMPGLSLR